jgi:hydrogenase maturation factor
LGILRQQHRRFSIEPPNARDNPVYECGAILRGDKRPQDCKFFASRVIRVVDDGF